MNKMSYLGFESVFSIKDFRQLLSADMICRSDERIALARP